MQPETVETSEHHAADCASFAFSHPILQRENTPAIVTATTTETKTSTTCTQTAHDDAKEEIEYLQREVELLHENMPAQQQTMKTQQQAHEQALYNERRYVQLLQDKVKRLELKLREST